MWMKRRIYSSLLGSTAKNQVPRPHSRDHSSVTESNRDDKRLDLRTEKGVLNSVTGRCQ